MGKPVEIDEEVVRAAERIAAKSNTTPGRVISDITRQAMSWQRSLTDLPVRDGLRYLPNRGGTAGA